MIEPSLSGSATPKRTRRFVRDWLPSILLIAGVLIARSTLADHYHVPSGSMEPGLMPGDHVVVNKLAYGLRVPFTTDVVAAAESPQRGDVVIFDSPLDGTRLIKRVVAIGGDHVTVRAGRVYLDGQAVAGGPAGRVEQYNEHRVVLNLSSGGGPELKQLRVPAGHLLVLGDHRGNSRDGRIFGTIPSGLVYGRAAGVFWRRSAGRAGIHSDPTEG